MPDRSAGFGRDDRAQTVQDFAIGTSIFLLTVAFAFAFVPSIFTPFETEVPPGANAQADRVGTSIVQDLSVENRSNWLDEGETEDFFDTSVSPIQSSSDIQNEFRLPLGSNVNVSVEPIEEGGVVSSGGTDLAIGTNVDNRPTATVTRVVAIEGVDECDPATDAGGKGCKLVVRVY
ncbi:hypothetical protein BRD00_10470 [Halobacteriales archaeon QS_8_69_26]|nr:MAG: hypothetical protein BRD00_10470 [Halobacteriales archaeon QS_8_69_26]